jgi:hypothetical protein
MIWIFGQEEFQELRQAGDGRIGLNAAPVTSAATTEGRHLIQTVAQKMAWDRHMPTFHAGKVIP